MASPQSSGATPIAQLPTPPTSGTSTPRTDARLKEARKEAFVPENVYDAMKENKRFDSMRVGGCFVFCVTDRVARAVRRGCS